MLFNSNYIKITHAKQNISSKFQSKDFSNISTSWVHKLNKGKLIKELRGTRKNLIQQD